MKKVIYIGIAVVALGLASCSKQDIQPNSADPVVPVWKANTGSTENDPSDPADPNGTGPITDPEINDGTITDPEINN